MRTTKRSLGSSRSSHCTTALRSGSFWCPRSLTGRRSRDSCRWTRRLPGHRTPTTRHCLQPYCAGLPASRYSSATRSYASARWPLTRWSDAVSTLTLTRRTPNNLMAAALTVLPTVPAATAYTAR